MGHLEYATPECANLFDAIAYDKAIEHVIIAILRETGLQAHVAFYKNNIDHYTGATFGCHENYQARRDVPFYRIVIPTLLPFFVTRQIYAGAGRVGAYDDILEFEMDRSASTTLTDTRYHNALTTSSLKYMNGYSLAEQLSIPETNPSVITQNIADSTSLSETQTCPSMHPLSKSVQPHLFWMLSRHITTSRRKTPHPKH